ncbi:HAMP domain-containing histidine kinase, partial [Candidatus Binatia bacterium]|nr:HAMP domain-containing histidine kinase [Candidatus Binatia bacterium]
LAGLRDGAAAQLGVALGFAATFAVIVADVLVLARERQDQHLHRMRGAMMRERRRTQSREEAIANLSHDLRNPLAIAVGFAEMAEDDALSEDDRANALSGIRRSLWEMSQMVENVLDGSADQAGALVPHPEPLDLERLCDEALAATRILLRRRPITLTGALEPGVLVFADRHRLARVIANLLGNACKYTVAGEIRVHTMACGGFAVIRVQDTGTGIASEALPHIFDRYRRAHAGGPAGAGLGLAIAHRLTERMGGVLEVESTLGVGSTFTVTLPLCAARGGALPVDHSVAA